MERSLGDSLRELRLSRGLSLGELSRRAGVSKAGVSSWESDRAKPRGQALARLLDVLEAEPRLRARLLHAADPAHARIALADTALGAPVDVGMVIRGMRRRRGLTQAEVARAVGTTQATVARWESGDVTPSGETIHALGFALGAAVEETLALACAQGGSSERLSNVCLDLEHHWDVLPHGHSALYEVASLGLEAELWPRAARDARWDPWLAKVVGERSIQLFLRGRLDDATATARRALRMASTPEAVLGQTSAFSTLLLIATLKKAEPSRVAAQIGTWAERLPEGIFKGWMLWERALRLALIDRADEGLELVERMVEMSAPFFNEDESSRLEAIRIRARLDVEVRAGRRDHAEDLLAQVLSIDTWGAWQESRYRVQIAHSQGEAADEALMAGLRKESLYWVGDPHGESYWYYRYKMSELERNQARLLLSQRRSRLGFATAQG